MEKNNKFDGVIIGINKVIIRFLMIILTVCLIFASLDLVKIIYQRITLPPFLLLDVATLFEIFNLLLIIAIGYELIKSFHTIVSSDTIPVIPIIQIAIIAIANKIITLDLKHIEPQILYGLASLLLGLGAAIFFSKHSKHQE